MSAHEILFIMYAVQELVLRLRQSTPDHPDHWDVLEIAQQAETVLGVAYDKAYGFSEAKHSLHI
jgi:hypothetical protein